MFPKEKTFQQLIQVTDTVHTNRVNGTWNKSEACAFMQNEGINTSTQNKILFNAANCTVENNMNNDNLNKMVIQNAVNRKKEKCSRFFLKWTCASWTRDIEIWQHVEAVMHLVFHCVQKTNMILIENWASWHGCLSSLKKFGNPILQKIQEINLDWCKLIPYNSGKFGGWLEENYLGMKRINCWFYSMLHTLYIEKEYKGGPIKCQTKWTKKENTA